MMQDIAHALNCKWRSLKDLQTLVLGGTYSNQTCTLKPLDNLKIGELQKELQARGYDTTDKLKPELQETLCSLLKGAQRVPTILTLNPTQSLHRLNLTDYEVLDCEPLRPQGSHLPRHQRAPILALKSSKGPNQASH